MRGLTFGRSHVLIGAGWLFAWLMLEMVFFGEPMFKYSSSRIGLTLYFIAICTVAIASIALSYGAVRRPDIMRSHKAMAICGGLGSVTLVLIRVSAGINSGASPWTPGIVVCSVAFGACATFLLGAFARCTIDEVFAQGLRGTLCAVLVGIALSFLVLPRFLRDGLYGETLVALSPLAVAAFTLLLDHGRAPGADERGEVGASDGQDDARARRMSVLILVELAALSFLMYLISYFDYVAASVQVVIEEDTYLYVAVLVMIAVLAATLLLARTERQLTTSVLLLLLFGIMTVTLVAFFGVLTYVVYGGSYVYPLTKLLRRVVKIGMLFALVITLYQSSLPASPTFLGVIVLPLVCGKLVQLTIATAPSLRDLVTLNEYFYLVGIGFVTIVLWSLALISCVRGGAILDAQASEGDRANATLEGWSAEPAARVGAMARAYSLTERETDVLRYLAAGYSLKAIAGKLCVSQNTVKTHVTGIYRKTGAHARQDVINLLHGDGGANTTKAH
ncbi:MAG: helix-turn-helix transcriptional regulator [Coriobacteriales bacterium]|jgi:DNA-binding CsgD family transcriptional regulator